MSQLANPMYLHCRQCISEGVKARIEAAVDGSKIEVWCKVHNKEIATFELATPTHFKCQGEHHD